MPLYSLCFYDNNIPYSLTDSVINLELDRMYILILVLLLYIPLGMFLGPIEIMLITLPIVYPVLVDLGFDGIWIEFC